MKGFDLVSLAAKHAAQIAAVATVAWCVTRLLAKDRPHLAHALWALVLLKSLTPPVIPSPTSPFSWMAVSRPSASARELQTNSIEMLSPAQTLVRVKTGDRFPIVEYPPPAGETMLHSEPARKISYQIWFLAVWAASSLVLLLYYAGQFSRFTIIVRKTSVAVPPSILEEVAQLRRRLRIRRPVQVRVLDALIGPAVMGILRPTLLLPKAIVCVSNSTQLRPLLAHELVHIRRGDLIWSAFQVIASSLWWFHPAVWLANRLLIQESERSCDEETIASLGCNPAAYARSLLAVLETKQQLLAAPIVPGLRPVDITSNRMERIMRIGHGSHSRTPGWVCATLIVGAIVMLPGAAWLRAQESGGESNSPGIRLPLAPQSFSDSPNTKGSDDTADASTIISTAPMAESKGTSVESIQDALQITLLVLEIPLELVDELRSVDTQIRAAKTEVRALRLDSDGNVNLTDKGSFVRSDLGIAGQLVIQDKSFVVPTSTSLPLAKPVPDDAGLPWLLNDAAQQRLQEWCNIAKDKNIRILSRPTLETQSGIPASVEIGQERPFRVGHDKKTGKPIIENMKTGLSCEISATLKKRDLNKADFSVPVNTQFVRMECRLRNSELLRVEEFTFALEDGQNLVVQQPSIYSQSAEFSLNVPLGATFASADGTKRSASGDFTTLFVVTVDQVRSAQTGDQANSQRNASSENGSESTGGAIASSANIETPRAHEYYTRVPIVGPIKMLEDRLQLEPPTDDEVLEAYTQSRGKTPEKSNHVVKEVIADYIDPARLVPQIGKAALHHRHYKCTIYSKVDGKEQVDVLYVDHNHYVMQDQ